MKSRDFVRNMDMKRDRFSIFVTASDRSKNAAEMPLAVQPGRTSICISCVCEWLFRYSAIWTLTGDRGSIIEFRTIHRVWHPGS